MITFEELKTIIDKKSLFDERLEELQKILNSRDLFEIDLVQLSFFFFDEYICSHFTEDGSDLIFWWLYEDVPKIIYENDIKYNVEDLKDLWNYLVKNNYLK